MNFQSIFKPNTIRTKLLINFVSIACLLTLGISLGSVIVGYFNGRQQAIDRLTSIAERKDLQLGTWVNSLHSQLVQAMNEKYSIDQASYVLEFDKEQKYSEYYYKAIRKQFQRDIQGSQDLLELFLLNLDGKVVLSTDPTHENRDYSDRSFFTLGLASPSIQLFPVTDIQNPASIIVAIPVLSQEGQLIGELAGRAKSDNISRILTDNSGLGNTGKSYIVSPSYLLFDASIFNDKINSDSAYHPMLIHSIGIDAAINNQTEGVGIYRDYQRVAVIGVYKWLPDMQVALLTEQALSEAFNGIILTLMVNLGISLIGVIVAAGASLKITRNIANPIDELVRIATQIAAGQLDLTAPVKRTDEIGILAAAFNSMTSQLRDLINSLEERVQERTRALQWRALQLETSTRVSKEISSILKIDDLLVQVEDLLRDAFGYYDVHVYLLDTETNQLIMASRNGSTSPKNKTISIATKSINGMVVQTRKMVLVRDVAQEPNYLYDEGLPGTRSELVVPIQIGDRLIGTLDVSSKELDAFSSEDVQVIKGMGDQIAIAVENARLYDSSRKLAALEERDRLARELHDSVAQSLYGIELRAKAVANYIERDPHLAEVEIEELRHTSHETLQEMRGLIYNLRPAALEDVGLVRALEAEIKNSNDPDRPRTTLDAGSLPRLPSEIEQCLFRVAQEALRNAIRHASANHISMVLKSDQGIVTLVVTDDGCGFDPSIPNPNHPSFGIIGMRERVELVKGHFQLNSQPGRGTRVEASIPLGK